MAKRHYTPAIWIYVLTSDCVNIGAFTTRIKANRMSEILQKLNKGTRKYRVEKVRVN